MLTEEEFCPVANPVKYDIMKCYQKKVSLALKGLKND